MKVNYENKTIHCFQCNQDLDFSQIYLDIFYQGSISCEKEHIIGNQSDLEWLYLIAPCNYFYLYHNEPNCRCIQDKCNCFGIEEKCDSPNGKK
jgi:hypothetical protein